MKVKRFVLSGVLAIPALLFPLMSCDDSKVPSEPAVGNETPDAIDGPSFTTVGFGSFWHDPHIKGPKVRTFTNDFLAVRGSSVVCDPSAKRFKSQDGAELRAAVSEDEIYATDLSTAPEDDCVAGVYPVDQKIRGKLLTQVRELDFSYAGGDEKGAPRMRIPIDECLAEINTTPSSSCTDGTAEGYAYIDAQTCNDGDGNVGVVNGEDREICPVRYRTDEPYPNWHAFVAAHEGARVARKILAITGFTGTPAAPVTELVNALTSVVLSPFRPGNSGISDFYELSPHYLIWKVDVR